MLLKNTQRENKGFFKKRAKEDMLKKEKDHLTFLKVN